MGKVKKYNEFLNESSLNNVEKLYHVSPNDFNKFEYDKIGETTDSGWFGKGFYFFKKYNDALGFSYRFGNNNIYEVKVKLNNAIDIKSDILPDDVKEAFEEKDLDIKTIWDIQSFCLENDNNPFIISSVFINMGYDGIILSLFDTVEYLIFNENNILSMEKV